MKHYRYALPIAIALTIIAGVVVIAQGSWELVWSNQCHGELRIRGVDVECWREVTDPTPTPVFGAMELWHPPGPHDGLNPHDHGDPAPDWADDWSITTFGHPVIYGGDEGTPNENAMKHQAYKGFAFTTNHGVDVFVRFHAQSNPHGRMAAYHSYEVYARDEAGGVSFWQGWAFFGWSDVPTQRLGRGQEKPGSYGDDWPGRDRVMIGTPNTEDWGPPNYLRSEQWYGVGGLNGPDFGITLAASTTLRPVEPGSEPDPMNQDTWMLTGGDGLSRTLHVTVLGEPNAWFVRGWSCKQHPPTDPPHEHGVSPTWTMFATDGPSCPDGYLAQHIADTLPASGITYVDGNIATKQFPGAGIVTVPN